MHAFDKNDAEILSRTHVGGNFLKIFALQLRHRLFRGGWSQPMTRELLERGHAVAVLLYDPHRDTVVLVQQFRVGALAADRNPWLLELPAGVIEAGESPEEVAIREVREETGATITCVEKICSCILSPGGCSETAHLYYAEIDSSSIGGIHGLPTEHEDIAVVKLASAEAFAILKRDFSDNATLVIALQWLQLRLGNN